MKFEELLMETAQQQCQRHDDLEESAMSLKKELCEEQALHKALRAVAGDSVSWPPRLSFLLLRPQVQELITEISMVEAEILRLDRQIQELKLQLYHEQRQNQEIQMSIASEQQEHRRQKHVRHDIPLRHDLHQRSMSQCYRHDPRDSASAHSRFSFAYAASDFFNATSTGFTDELSKFSRTKGFQIVEAKTKDDPNDVSEQLIRCLIGIYLELNQASSPSNAEAGVVSKRHVVAHSRRRSLSGKATIFTCYQNALNLDPYCIMSDSNGDIRDVGPYKNFIHITKSSLDVSSFAHFCSPAVPQLRVLMEKLAEVDLSFLTYKQKLAFWINTYNACVMHAFLVHGLPSSHNKLLTLMNKASLNVGGIVLNALAIEHFILRHPCEPEHGLHDEKETLLRHAYGLGYSEPNVTFALCRGSWSSPALRVYTPDNVVNDLGRARVEYLEASVGVSSKRKIVIPQLLQWHMKDFADDMESLLEWIYSQLPRSGSLKGMIMECLNRKSKTPLAKIVEIQTYGHEFRYLLSL